MKTLLEVVTLAAEFLKEKGIERPKREAEWVIADVLGLRRIDLFLQYERPLVEEELRCCREAIVRRAKGEPAAYIAGRVSVAGIELKVTPAVLIPRPETEILIEKIAQELKTQDLAGKTLWDLCSGSGLIGLALKKRFPALHVVLSDLSEEALAVARENAARNDVEVECLLGDLFAPFAGRTCAFFVCNPPYVSEEEYLSLDPKVKHFEPKTALLGGKTGVEFYERIAEELHTYLPFSAQGWLEIGSGQGERVLSHFTRAGWGRSYFERDYAGHDRYFFIRGEDKSAMSMMR